MWGVSTFSPCCRLTVWWLPGWETGTKAWVSTQGEAGPTLEARAVSALLTPNDKKLTVVRNRRILPKSRLLTGSKMSWPSHEVWSLSIFSSLIEGSTITLTPKLKNSQTQKRGHSDVRITPECREWIEQHQRRLGAGWARAQSWPF